MDENYEFTSCRASNEYGKTHHRPKLQFYSFDCSVRTRFEFSVPMGNSIDTKQMPRSLSLSLSQSIRSQPTEHNLQSSQRVTLYDNIILNYCREACRIQQMPRREATDEKWNSTKKLKDQQQVKREVD